MPTQTLNHANAAPGFPPQPAADRRLHPRIAVVILGRFMRESKHEYPCKMIDASAGGAAIMAPVTPDLGEKIIAYFDQLGGLEGKIVRHFQGGFALQFIMTQHKREKLVASLMFIQNKHEQPDLENRRHERLMTKNNMQQLTVGEGLTIECQVHDMSISGANILTSARPALGADLKLGNLKARVVRHHDQGIGVEFTDMQNPNALRRYFG